jgi:hypothetical protein
MGMIGRAYRQANRLTGLAYTASQAKFQELGSAKAVTRYLRQGRGQTLQVDATRWPASPAIGPRAASALQCISLAVDNKISCATLIISANHDLFV